MHIKRISTADISDNYLDALKESYKTYFLNDFSITQFIHSNLKQVSSSDRKFEPSESILFGVFESGSNIGAFSTNFSFERKSVNIEILFFLKSMTSRTPKSALKTLTYWIQARFPVFSIEMVIPKSSFAITKLALSCGYKIKKCGDSGLACLYFPRDGDEVIDERISLTNRDALFFGTDTGGVEALLEIYFRTEASKSLVVKGRGIEALEFYGLDSSSPHTIDASAFDTLIYSTGANPSKSQTMQSYFHLAQKRTVSILDHWVNYQSRFNLPNGQLPEFLVISNEIAFGIARKFFPNKKLVLVPDFRLKRLARLLPVNLERVEEFLLLVLEPERTKLEGLDRITNADIINSIKVSKVVAKELGLMKIRVRLHPEMDVNKDLQNVILGDDTISLSPNPRIEDDLPSIGAVIGFSSSVLYFAAKLKIPTFSILKCTQESWLGQCKEIVKIDPWQY